MVITLVLLVHCCSGRRCVFLKSLQSIAKPINVPKSSILLFTLHGFRSFYSFKLNLKLAGIFYRKPH